MALEQHVHAQFFCRRIEQLHLRRLEEVRHQQDRIGAKCTRFVHLVLVENEVLAQNGFRSARLHFAQPIHAHAEMRVVGQHRNRAHNLALFVRGGCLVYVLPSHWPVTGRTLLDLPNDAEGLLQCALERSHRRGVSQHAPQFGQRPLRLRLRQLAPDIDRDRVENRLGSLHFRSATMPERHSKFNCRQNYGLFWALMVKCDLL